MKGKTVVVGMSGGVDSSVAAYLLKEEGYNVIGVTMQIWQDESECTVEENGGCCGLSAVEDARRVAEKIGIPYYVMNFKEVFKKQVMDYFTEEYLNARTPNPCIACNRYVKWEALLKKSLDIGADYIATGHYAKIRTLDNKRLTICNSRTAEKDQTYALYNLTQEQLSKSLLPIGDYTKEDIRRIASDVGLPVAAKKDSQEICFIPDRDYGGFIEKTVKDLPKEGDFINTEGKVIGRHKGLYHYTIGQRRGLGISAGERIFVKELLPKTNQVVLCGNEELFTRTARMTDISYMGVTDFSRNDIFLGKIRYNDAGTCCRAKKTGEDEITVTFEKPVRAVTPGQAMVLYRQDYIAFGGTII